MTESITINGRACGVVHAVVAALGTLVASVRVNVTGKWRVTKGFYFRTKTC